MYLILFFLGPGEAQQNAPLAIPDSESCEDTEPMVKLYLNFWKQIKVSVLEVVKLGGHFASLCRELDFYEAIFFPHC